MNTGLTLSRLVCTILGDIRIQFRNGFYYAVLFVVALWVILFWRLPGLGLGEIWPVLLFTNLIITTFYFMGGLILLEKGEGTLAAQVVTPLRTWEYLASKVLTLGLLAVFENLLLTVFIFGMGFKALPLVLGLALAGVMYTLLGFLVVARYDSINEYLLPSMLYIMLFSLPVAPYFGLKVPGLLWLLYLHPLQAPLVLIQAAFQPVQIWQILYACSYSALMLSLIYSLALRAFRRFVIIGEGVR
jgi:fluoroquinolone transport system permease protein